MGRGLRSVNKAGQVECRVLINEHILAAKDFREWIWK